MRPAQALRHGAGEELPAEEADTAVFYSISNCQRGLKGISFGNFLIKRVVAVAAQFPVIRSKLRNRGSGRIPLNRRWSMQLRPSCSAAAHLTRYGWIDC